MEGDIRYKSILSKETLIYNLIYHLRDCKDEEDGAARIRSVLEHFEDKEKYCQKCLKRRKKNS